MCMFSFKFTTVIRIFTVYLSNVSLKIQLQLPIEYHTQRLRAVQDFEPENGYDRLGCVVNDRFLLIYEDPNSDWILATSLKSRHSGYLPKSCVEKEYPEIIERLDFFHPDPTPHPKELLKKG
uniref:SH3 domain-containing protein n=1 Tax=Schistosoma haematobium TaxID=6185 RepID=A0A094ZYH5_SCHHA